MHNPNKYERARRKREQRRRNYFKEQPVYDAPEEEQRIAYLQKVIKTDAGASFKGTPL
jgi:hypothetical protein